VTDKKTTQGVGGENTVKKMKRRVVGDASGKTRHEKKRKEAQETWILGNGVETASYEEEGRLLLPTE